MLAELIEEMGERLSQAQLRPPRGRILEIVGTRISTTLTCVSISEVCILRNGNDASETLAQVVAVNERSSLLAPIGTISGLGPDTEVIATGKPFSFLAGDALLGKVLDGLGRPADGSWLRNDGTHLRSVEFPAPDPLSRPLVRDVFETGITAIDAFNTLGHGQRVGVFGPPGAGKTSLMGALARHADCDVCVLALIGERGREVREFLDHWLPPEFRDRTVTLAATSDRPAMERCLAAETSVALAHHYRSQGRKVLLLFDSMTRYARALREVGLASGEPAVRRGFTASVYAALPRLIERCGQDETGSMTAIFSVLTENEGIGDPIAEEVMSLTDGHLILSPELANAGQYPAIDILKSKSRLMDTLTTSQHRAATTRIKSLMARYKEIEILLQVGEYQAGSDPLSDSAIAIQTVLREFLTQDVSCHRPFSQTLDGISKVNEVG